MKRIFCFLMLTAVLLAALPGTVCCAAEEETAQRVYQHPFMLTDSARLQRLAEIGEEEPWKSMKAEALRNAEMNFIRRDMHSDLVVMQNMYKVISYNMVGYILEAENAAVYKDRVLEAIAYFDRDNPETVIGGIYTEDGDNWNGSVPPGNTFVTAVVALDILYPSLTKTEIEEAEKALQCVADAFWDKTEVHTANTWGVRGIWAAYQQDMEKLQQCWKQWQVEWHDSFNSDGGQLASSEYAMQRYAESERNGKILLPYVMDYMGLDHSFFADEKNKNAFEFLLGYTYAPNNSFWVFGDTRINAVMDSTVNQGAFVAGRYSDDAAHYGAFIAAQDPGAGTLLKLLFGNDDGRMVQAEAPPSRIYEKTGAFFYEDFANRHSLAGVMYNQTKAASINGHSHTETNAIGLCAYGSIITGGSGYALFRQPCEGFSWNYIQQSAVSANTVLINYDPVDIRNPSEYNDHNSQWKYRTDDSYGKGIVNGFTDDLLCYAKGESGNALPNGTHNRSFVMVASQDYVPGYFVEFDDVQAQQPGDVVTVVQRPYSKDYETLTENTEYEWTISGRGENDVNLSVFMVNEPDQVEFWDGVAAGTSERILLKSLFSKYNADENGHVHVATILFPSDENHQKADMTRIETVGAKGAKVALGNGITDYVFASDGNPCTYFITEQESAAYQGYDKLYFTANNVILRKNNGINAMYFAEDATQLLGGEEGFTANHPVNIFMKDGKGTVEAMQDTELTFRAYGITGVNVNGEAAQTTAANDGVRVSVAAGTSEIELVCDASQALAQMLNGSIANNCFDNMTIIDTNHGRMLHHGNLEPVDVWEENSVTYVSAETARNICGGTYGGARAALRLSAEANGYTVQWHESGLIFISAPGASFDFEADAPNLGLALRIFDAAQQTQITTNIVPQVDVLVNGAAVPTFDPHVYEHTVSGVGDAFELTATANGETTIEDIDDNVKRLTVTQGKNKTCYTFRYQEKTRSDIIITASAEPQAENSKENVLDGNLNTRWSAEGNQWICFEFFESRQISELQLAWAMGDERTSAFSVEISDDGQTWQTVFDGASSGTTLQPETVPTGAFSAKYIRINGSGNTLNAWTSVSEVLFVFAD